MKKYKLHLSRLFCFNHTCYCVNMVSVTLASHYITSASCNHPRYQSRSSINIRGLIPRNFAELVEAVWLTLMKYFTLCQSMCLPVSIIKMFMFVDASRNALISQCILISILGINLWKCYMYVGIAIPYYMIRKGLSYFAKLILYVCLQNLKFEENQLLQNRCKLTSVWSQSDGCIWY